MTERALARPLHGGISGASPRVAPALDHRAEVPDVALVILNNSGVGGAERRFAQVYEGLRSRNVAIALAINESLLTSLIQAGVLTPGTTPEFLMKEPIGRRAFGLRKLDYALGCLSLARWVLARRPRLLHLVLGGAYVALPLQVLDWAPPALLSVVCPSLREMVGSSLGLWLYRLALRKACVVDALTEQIRDTLEREGVPPERIRVPAGSFVNTTRFQPASAKRPSVVFVGRLIPEKDPALFVEACALVHKLVPYARFFMLGEGPLRDQVETLVRDRGLAAVMEVGWRSRVEAVLGEALVFVSLQRMDNYPSQALLEAMASGAAVVATDVGLTWKLVDEQVGVRVAASAESVAQAIVLLLDDPSRASAMGLRGRERVIERHSTEAYLDYLECLYEWMREAAAGAS